EVDETVAVQSQVEDVATLGAADVRELTKTRHFEQLRVQFGRAPADNLGRLGMLARGDHGPPRLDDTSLLIGDRRARRAQELHVVEVDVGNHRDARVSYVGRVQAP